MTTEALEFFNEKQYETCRYYKRLDYSGEATSIAYLFPNCLLSEIAVQFSGSPVIYFTASAKEEIEADTAIWEAWDGYSKVNEGVSAFYVDNPDSAAVVVVSARGEMPA